MSFSSWPERHGKPKSFWGAAIIVAVWLVLAYWAWTVVREWRW